MFTLIIYFYHSLKTLTTFITEHLNPTQQPVVIYESPHFKFINKPPDMRINSNNPSHYTLQTFLCKNYPKQANKKLFHNFYFVHRLDFATSGIICIPMTKRACRLISEVFQSRNAQKYYLAIVRGIMSQKLLIVSYAIGEDLSADAVEAQKMCTADSLNCRDARNATTIITALEEGFYENYPGTKLLIRPITGRRHQIRVHCARLGHTIVGDYTYSNKTDVKPRRMFLHSLRLVLPNDLEFVDLQTEDPFDKAARGHENWMVYNRYQTMDEAYDLLGRYANAHEASVQVS